MALSQGTGRRLEKGRRQSAPHNGRLTDGMADGSNRTGTGEGRTGPRTQGRSGLQVAKVKVREIYGT